jgi:hypothetical protein
MWAGRSGDRIPVEARFSAPVQTGLGAHQAYCTMSTRIFPGGKERPGRDADPSPPSSAVGHERVEQYLYSPYGPYGLYIASVPCKRVHFTFTLTDKLLVKLSLCMPRRRIIDTKHPVGLLWTSDQLVAEAATCTTHNKHNRLTFISSTGFEPAIPTIELYLRPHRHRDRLSEYLAKSITRALLVDINIYFLL